MLAGGTFCASPAVRYSLDGGPCFIGRPASTPQLHRTRTPSSPQSAGKRAAPAAPDGEQRPVCVALGKATTQFPPSTETSNVPASRSSATPSVLPAGFQSPTTDGPLLPLPQDERVRLIGATGGQGDGMCVLLGGRVGEKENRGNRCRVLPSWYTAHDAAFPPTCVSWKLVPANPTCRHERCAASSTSTSNHTRPAEWHRCTAPADL